MMPSCSGDALLCSVVDLDEVLVDVGDPIFGVADLLAVSDHGDNEVVDEVGMFLIPSVPAVQPLGGGAPDIEVEYELACQTVAGSAVVDDIDDIFRRIVGIVLTDPEVLTNARRGSILNSESSMC
jgi:hypothetical protein